MDKKSVARLQSADRSVIPTMEELKGGYKSMADVLKSQIADKTNFGEGESVIGSAVHNPGEATQRIVEWLKNNMQTAGGMPTDEQYADANPFEVQNPSMEQQAEAGLNLAGTAMTGSMPFAPPSSGGTLGTFIGPKAKNWNPEVAAKAKAALDAGINPEQVWREHMMGRINKNSPMFSEIPDNTATYRNTGGFNMSYEHPELMENYPALKDIEIKRWNERSSSFDKSKNRATIGMLADKPESSFAHEFQHPVQNIEGWARGGNPISMQMELAGKLNPKTGKLYSMPEAYGDSFDLYLRLTGEAQARATQDRLLMDLAARRNNYPLKGGRLSDIKIEELIDRYGIDDAQAMMVSSGSRSDVPVGQAWKTGLDATNQGRYIEGNVPIQNLPGKRDRGIEVQKLIDALKR